MENVFLKISKFVFSSMQAIYTYLIEDLVNDSSQQLEMDKKKRSASHTKRESIGLADNTNTYHFKWGEHRTRKQKLTTKLLSVSNERNLSINKEYGSRLESLDSPR